MTLTQTQRVKRALRQGTLTVKQAQRRFGVQRLSARVFELRHDDKLTIRTEKYVRPDGTRAGRYRLIHR